MDKAAAQQEDRQGQKSFTNRSPLKNGIGFSTMNIYLDDDCCMNSSFAPGVSAGVSISSLAPAGNRLGNNQKVDRLSP